jgi:hypothetical protein
MPAGELNIRGDSLRLNQRPPDEPRLKNFNSGPRPTGRVVVIEDRRRTYRQGVRRLEEGVDPAVPGNIARELARLVGGFTVTFNGQLCATPAHLT